MQKRPFLCFMKQFFFTFYLANFSSIKCRGIAFSGCRTDGRTDGAVFMGSEVGCLNGDAGLFIKVEFDILKMHCNRVVPSVV